MIRHQSFNVVLVHDGVVDGAGSGWSGVYDLLRGDGYQVTVVRSSTRSLARDAAMTKLALAEQDRRVILVGHSYGGAVITEAGNEPTVAALVYIAAFAPAAGESVHVLIKDPFMAAAQVPWDRRALTGTITQPAWKAKPSWYMVTSDDLIIPPPAQRIMAKRAGATIVEEKGSHAIYMSRPEVVHALVTSAAQSKALAA